MRAGLLRNRSLAALLVAETVSMTGSMMTWLALPWFVLATTGSAGRMGVVLAAEALGVALCGVPGGSISARLGARRTMLVVNAVAAPLILAVPVLHWAGALSFAALLAIVFVIGGLFGPYFAAQRVAVSELLGEDEALVSDANAFLQAAQRLALLLGPVLAGILITAIGAPSVLLVDAATFAFALAMIALFVPAAEQPAQTEESRGLFAGLRYLTRNRVLRSWAVSVAVGDAAWNACSRRFPSTPSPSTTGTPGSQGCSSPASGSPRSSATSCPSGSAGASIRPS